MADEAVKKRIDRAKKKPAKDLVDMGYCVVPSDNSRACLVAFRSVDIRIIRIVLDDVLKKDHELLKAIDAPTVCSREIWLRRTGSGEFHKIQIS